MSENTWFEQEVVLQWMEDRGIELDFQETKPLIDALTEPRLKRDKRIEELEAERRQRCACVFADGVAVEAEMCKYHGTLQSDATILADFAQDVTPAGFLSKVKSDIDKIVDRHCTKTEEL